jgi:hypothetical protein
VDSRTVREAPGPPEVAAWLGIASMLIASAVLLMAARASDLFLVGDTKGSLHIAPVKRDGQTPALLQSKWKTLP